MIDPTLDAQSMTYCGPASIPLQMFGPQIWGTRPNAAQQARIDAGEDLERMWHGEIQQEWWGMYDSPVAFCRGLRRAFPKLRIIRVPFNIHYWTRDADERLAMSPNMEAFFAECAVDRSDWQLMWDFHDGPTQMLQDPNRHATWPGSYPILVENFDDWHAASIALGERQVRTWEMLFEWLGARPALQRQTIGYEVMNEPAAYANGERLFRAGTPPAGIASWNAYFVGRFVDHIEAIVRVIDANDPGKFILAPTYSYNGDAQILHDTRMPSGARAIDEIRRIIGLHRLIWSIHFYAGFDVRVATQAAHDKAIVARWGVLGTDPVCVTEMNVHGQMHNPARQGDFYKHYFRHRHTRWLTDKVAGWPGKRPWGVSWWPAVNWAQASAIRIALGGDEPVLQRRFSTAAAIHHWALGNHPEWFDGPQSGPKGWEPHVIRATNGMEPAHWEPDGWHLLAAMEIPNRDVNKNMEGWLLSYGGRGTTFHDCAPWPGAGVTLQVEGGDGKTVIHAQENHQYQYHHFHLGEGGGVVRLGHGSHVVLSKGGPATVYTYAADVAHPPETELEAFGYRKNRGHAVIAIPYGWNNRIICDPTSVTQLYGFDPAKGDRLSFKGAFGSISEMRAAMRVVENQAAIKGRDIEIDLPGGGRLQMIDAGGLANRLHNQVLDFTEGWYGQGFTEPVDYTEAEFTDPIPLIPPPPAGESASPWVDRNGHPVHLLDRRGQPIATAKGRS